ncbi:hypothetical protein [Pseudomonas cedrina]|uniref:hypothetical protein n=1 Tax=Pseudomonas cedrina TaxID=651740 RepID=UPI0027828E2F|nr:hypothetical protein [Pseudomonas cedrina]MDQ0655145.1 hypothetical protein [Pseudomonas cedrina]
MSTCNKELKALISKAEAMGATVQVGYDMDALIGEGRSIICDVQVSGLKGCGPFPMQAITAAERLRELTA